MTIMGCLMFRSVQDLSLMFHMKNSAAKHSSSLVPVQGWVQYLWMQPPAFLLEGRGDGDSHQAPWPMVLTSAEACSEARLCAAWLMIHAALAWWKHLFDTISLFSIREGEGMLFGGVGSNERLIWESFLVKALQNKDRKGMDVWGFISPFLFPPLCPKCLRL